MSTATDSIGHLMTERTVNKLSPQKTAERLAPVLADYAAKLSALNERAANNLMSATSSQVVRYVVQEAARLICLRDALEAPVTEAARTASALLEHTALEQVTWLELKLRLDELEEHLHFSQIAVDELKRFLEGTPGFTAEVRKAVERTRLKAPF